MAAFVGGRAPTFSMSDADARIDAAIERGLLQHAAAPGMPLEIGPRGSVVLQAAEARAVWDAGVIVGVEAEHEAGTLVACSTMHGRQREPGTAASVHRHCPWCLGIGWRADYERWPAVDVGDPSEPIGIAGIARLLGVERATVDQWRQRPTTGFPAPSWPETGSPQWRRGRIYEWAAQTGRLPSG